MGTGGGGWRPCTAAAVSFVAPRSWWGPEAQRGDGVRSPSTPLYSLGTAPQLPLAQPGRRKGEWLEGTSSSSGSDFPQPRCLLLPQCLGVLSLGKRQRQQVLPSPSRLQESASKAHETDCPVENRKPVARFCSASRTLLRGNVCFSRLLPACSDCWAPAALGCRGGVKAQRGVSTPGAGPEEGMIWGPPAD